MKTFIKFLLVPAACQALLVSTTHAAKSDDPNDPNYKNGKRREQSTATQGQAPASGQAPQQKKMDSGMQLKQPQVQRQPQQPTKQPQTQVQRQPQQPPKQTQQAQTSPKHPAREIDKTPEPQLRKPVPQGVKKPLPDVTSQPPAMPRNKPETLTKKDHGPSDLQGGRTDASAGKPGAMNKHPDKVDQAGGKPMTLPGKRPGADLADKSNPDVMPGANDKPAKLNKVDAQPMTLPGKRPGADMVDKGGKNGKNGKFDKTPATTKPMPLPGKRPNVPPGLADKTPDHPNAANRPGNNDLPNGMPGKRPDVPAGLMDKNPNRPGNNGLTGNQNLNNPNFTNKDAKKNLVRQQPVVRPGQNTKQVRRPDFQQNNKSNTWWNSSSRVTSTNVRNVSVTNVTTVNNNFRQSVNWNTSRHAWGYNPWWNRPATRPWYGSSWNGGWNTGYYHHHYNYYGYGGYRPPGYYHNDVAEAIGWGLIGWSLGAIIYDSGYHSYYNPYPVAAVPVSSGYEIDYRQPITEVAVRSAPANDAAVAECTKKSESLIAESQSAFKQKNYLVALELADKAIAASPGDGALHEYRALVLFALGKYGDAAGVLNPVLASGPGWDWSTMIALYDAQETYTDQLQKLETYTEQKPDAADSHFLLGYHYMVCGHLDLATPQFDTAYRLMPSDSVSKQLAELTRASKPAEGTAPEKAEESAPAPAAAPQPVPLEKLTGIWVSNREGGGSITLRFAEDGKFTWAFVKDGKTNEFSGEYSINDNGLLVLDSKESQMVASVDMPQDREMKFVLAGGPPADPGLAFVKN